ncbi:hypothetical protein NOR_07888 [Metarhizium rileyi]|uniref:Uncharacterized protein n=1 Tax=Metarhizium rileyi (strain RCEF 4871) TaxID=1649241 RepID=A0A166XDQ0_METRR|nr:hypothetical protein NOR_07888 [Metarhizium rileyi RCEF 4871]
MEVVVVKLKKTFLAEKNNKCDVENYVLGDLDAEHTSIYCSLEVSQDGEFSIGVPGMTWKQTEEEVRGKLLSAFQPMQIHEMVHSFDKKKLDGIKVGKYPVKPDAS